MTFAWSNQNNLAAEIIIKMIRFICAAIMIICKRQKTRDFPGAAVT